MDMTSFDEKTRLLGATSWRAIAAGVFIALALQVLLLLLGLGFALGDERISGGYQAWSVLVQLSSIAVGAALAARLSHLGSRSGGIAAGIMTWAVVLVLGGAVQGFLMVPPPTAATAWAAFFGAIFGLGAAILGGALGATVRGRPTGATPAPREDVPSHVAV
jgi:hypothetical protein